MLLKINLKHSAKNETKDKEVIDSNENDSCTPSITKEQRMLTYDINNNSIQYDVFIIRH